MPNWVWTQLSITGDKESIKKFKEDASKENRVSENPYDRGQVHWHIFESIIPIPEHLPHTVDSQIKIWGVKWGDCQTELEDESDTKLVFNTQFPWGIPVPAMLEISSMYPGLLFNLDMDEEGGFFWGEMEFQDGQVVRDGVLDEPSPRYKEWQEMEDDE